ncbi:hypothetical protein Pogu_1559 [Pyrobaculum oguniense TE7]|uniref:Uncharacterized protein n=1 Tax=Pyrobaculum oguniense (strain DSM 13380 / JCM 10595 / TE7) TaxID=698757 RepID=H6Q957_PYROT|nr:hypothetical protein Pogu_1559 [Pyrobaculum oguniense TE7]
MVRPMVLLAVALAVAVQAGVLYVNMSKYVVEVNTTCGPAYIFTAPFDYAPNLGKWLVEEGFVQKYDSPIRKKAREMLGIESEDRATLDQWKSLVALSQSLLSDKVRAVEGVLRGAGVEVIEVGGVDTVKIPSDKVNNGSVYAFVRLSGRLSVLKDLERVADQYNISILVIDLPRVRAHAANKTVDSIPGLGAPTHGLATVTMFGQFGDLAYYVRRPDEKTIKAVEKYLRERELCGVAVLFVPGEGYVPRLLTAETRRGSPVLSLVALAAGAAAVAAALLLLFRRRV